jgi:hypothetical protein
MDVFAMNHHSSATTLQEFDVGLSATRTLTPFHHEIAFYPFPSRRRQVMRVVSGAYATSWTTPPASLIFFSASALK